MFLAIKKPQVNQTIYKTFQRNLIGLYYGNYYIKFKPLLVFLANQMEDNLVVHVLFAGWTT